MSTPSVGLPTVTAGGCAYSADLDTRSCGQPCTIHVAVRSRAWGTVSLASCGDHASIARASGTVLGSHAYLPACETTDCWEGIG